MFRRYYTTQMSDSVKQLQMRFTRIRTKSNKMTHIMTSIISVVLIITICMTVIVMASYDGMKFGNGTLIVNDKEYIIDIIHFDNQLYLNNDSYYIPLRETFEILGCDVKYDVEYKSVDRDFEKDSDLFPQYAWPQLEEMAINDTLIQLLGATERMNKNMPVIEITKLNGEKWYCQVGSKYYKNGWAPPVVIYNDKAYISIRAVAYYLIPNGEDEDMSILWDASAHDTYYMGRMEWNAENMTVTINPEAGPGNEVYINAFKKLQNKYGFKNISQRIENRDYLICVIDNYGSENNTSCVSLDKSTGKIAVLDNFNGDKPIFIGVDANEFIVSMFDVDSNALREYKRYNLADYRYLEIGY